VTSIHDEPPSWSDFVAMLRLIFWVIVVTVALAVFVATAATECQTEPNDPTQRWWWRVIDGRRCWYVGQRMMDKSLLYWRKESQCGIRDADGKPCCHENCQLPPTEFEDRWNALYDTPYAHNATPAQDWKMW
jgi:hypothetical protein